MTAPTSDLRPPTSGPKVIGYVRASTDKQKNTLEAQPDQIRAYCSYKKFHLLDCIIDEDESAVAVDFLEREKVAAMLLRMKEAGATQIIVAKLDRAFRGAVDLLLTIELLKGQGINVHLLDIGLDPTTPTGEMVATIMASVARFECRRRAERQKDCFAVMKRTNQRCGGVPYGWDTTKANRLSKTTRVADDLIPNEEEQRILRMIVAWRDDEPSDPSDLRPPTSDFCPMAWSAIARNLNQLGVPTKQGGKKWYPATVQSVYDHRRLSPPAHDPDQPGELAA